MAVVDAISWVLYMTDRVRVGGTGMTVDSSIQARRMECHLNVDFEHSDLMYTIHTPLYQIHQASRQGSKVAAISNQSASRKGINRNDGTGSIGE